MIDGLKSFIGADISIKNREKTFYFGMINQLLSNAVYDLSLLQEILVKMMVNLYCFKIYFDSQLMDFIYE